MRSTKISTGNRYIKDNDIRQKVVTVADHNQLWDDVETLENLVTALINAVPGAGSTLTLTDGISTFRFEVRDSTLSVDVTLTPTGFSGVEGNDWENLWQFTNQPI